MRTIILALLFLSLVGLLFYGLFNQPINKDTREIRLQMRADKLLERQTFFIERNIKRCTEDIYEEAEIYVDSIIASPTINPVNDMDSLIRPYRPNARYSEKNALEKIELEPLFETVDSLTIVDN